MTDFYGQHFFASGRGARQAGLGFQCECRACREDWPLLAALPQFSPAQLAARPAWREGRARLQRAVERMRCREVLQTCIALATTAAVPPPHQATVMPEMFLHYSAVFLFGNKSIRFQQFAKKILEDEDSIKSSTKKKHKQKKLK